MRASTDVFTMEDEPLMSCRLCNFNPVCENIWEILYLLEFPANIIEGPPFFFPFGSLDEHC
jgi:hypothetical protein